MFTIEKHGAQYPAKQTVLRHPGQCAYCGRDMAPGTRGVMARVPSDPNPRVAKPMWAVQHESTEACAGAGPRPRPVRCGECQSCLAGGPCDETE